MAKMLSGVGVLDKGMAILDVVERRRVSTSELAREIDLPVSTTHRLAGALLAHGLLRRDDEGRYYLGPRLTTTLVSSAQTVLEDLQRKTGENAQLWVRRGNSRLCVASAESEEVLRATLPVGSLLRLPKGSAGHVLSGELEVGGTHHGLGWLEAMEERTPGVGSVSAPVRRQGELVAAVCVFGPLHRVGPSPGEKHGAQTIAAARRLEAIINA
jgi:DNA-binding IclR family transcriptional regulator